jgi:PIN domain nuclease of toxin-antitoxin system
VILLDTNALIWLEQGRSRARPLRTGRERLYISPANLLELQFLLESGRLRFRGVAIADLVQRGPWLLDDPPSAAWFENALDLGWTRDPFDRLLVAHA